MQIGKTNRLEVTDVFPFGYYLSDASGQQAVLPDNEIDRQPEVGETLEVFVYHDSDDRLVATTRQPLAQRGEVAFLRVKSVAEFGAFLDWGLDKDLFVHSKAQDKPMAEGLSYVVYLYQDKTSDRIAGSSRLRDFLSEDGRGLSARQPVTLTIYGKTDLGYKAVVNDTHLGLIFKDEVFQSLRVGDILPGYVKRIRSDGKIDLCFQFHDADARKDLATQILEDLEAHGGLSTLTDKSPAAEISARFGVSKGAYKKALGALYKAGKINLDKSKISLK